MANFQKDVKKLKKAFARLVVANNGTCQRRKSNGSDRVDYRIGDRKVFYVWHSSLSDSFSLMHLKKNLYDLADKLGISRDDSEYAIGFAVLITEPAAWKVWKHESEAIFEEIAQKLNSADRPT